MHHICTKNVSNTTIYNTYEDRHHSKMKIPYIITDRNIISSTRSPTKIILLFYSVY